MSGSQLRAALNGREASDITQLSAYYVLRELLEKQKLKGTNMWQSHTFWAAGTRILF